MRLQHCGLIDDSDTPIDETARRERATWFATVVCRALPPSEMVILERAKSLCNVACFTIALQCRRLKTSEPEDEIFVLHWYADLRFLILTLRRLRRAAKLAADVPSVSACIEVAIFRFDKSLPGLGKLRNVDEHIDDYVRGNPKNQHKEIIRDELQRNSFDGSVFYWLGAELDIDVALKAAEALFAAVVEAVKQVESENLNY